jgi:hypothetical protein
MIARRLADGDIRQSLRRIRPETRELSAYGGRDAWSHRAAAIRAATVAESSGSSPPMSATAGSLGNPTQRSMRSRRGPEIRAT